MALPCEPCDCPDAYFRDNGTFKRTVLQILCETREVMENIVITGGGGGDLSGYVPTSRTVNGHALTGNITILASDIDLSGYVPTSRTVNGQALSANVTLAKSDVGLANVANVDTTTTANITDALNKRFVTDAQLVVIGNTSNTNTGDQTVSSLGLTQTKIRSVGAAFDGGGSAVTVGSKAYVVVPFAGTITGWNVTVSSGTCTVDVWKIANGTAIPTVANTITAAAKPAIAANTNVHSTTLTGWTTSVAANDIIAFNVDAATATWINVSIEVTV